MPRAVPGAGNARKGNEKPIRSPDERNLLQFSPFAGLEDGSLSPSQRFRRVMTNKSGSNAPPTFRAVHSNDLSQAGSMDSHDEECKNEGAIGKDQMDESELPRPQHIGITHTELQPSSSSIRKKRAWRGTDTNMLQSKSAKDVSGVSGLRKKVLGVNTRVAKPREETVQLLNLDVKSPLEPYLNPSSSSIQTPTANRTQQHQGRYTESEQDSSRSSGDAGVRPKESVEIDNLVSETKVTALTEQNRTRSAEPGDEAGFSKTATRMTKMFPKSHTRERFEVKSLIFDDSESDTPLTLGSVIRRLTPRRGTRARTVSSMPEGDEEESDLRHKKSSMNSLSQGSGPLRLSRSLDAVLESRTVRTLPGRLSPSSEDVGLLKAVLGRSSRPSNGGISPTGDQAANALVPSKNPLRDLMNRKSGRQRHSPNGQNRTMDKKVSSRKGAVSDIKARKGAISPLRRYSPMQTGRKGQHEDLEQSRSHEKGSPKFSSTASNSLRSLGGNSAVENSMSDEDFTKRSVEIEKYLNSVNDF